MRTANPPFLLPAVAIGHAGYDDVFLGNLRGNRFSRNSTVWDPDADTRFWRFSYDEHAEHDVPAMVAEALRVSGAQDLQYVGYSQVRACQLHIQSTSGVTAPCTVCRPAARGGSPEVVGQQLAATRWTTRGPRRGSPLRQGRKDQQRGSLGTRPEQRHPLPRRGVLRACRGRWCCWRVWRRARRWRGRCGRPCCWRPPCLWGTSPACPSAPWRTCRPQRCARAAVFPVRTRGAPPLQACRTGVRARHGCTTTRRVPSAAFPPFAAAQVFQRWGMTEFGAHDPRAAELAAKGCSLLPSACVK